jgi:hypothetical protein
MARDKTQTKNEPVEKTVAAVRKTQPSTKHGKLEVCAVKPDNQPPPKHGVDLLELFDTTPETFAQTPGTNANSEIHKTMMESRAYADKVLEAKMDEEEDSETSHDKKPKKKGIVVVETGLFLYDFQDGDFTRLYIADVSERSDCHTLAGRIKNESYYQNQQKMYEQVRKCTLYDANKKVGGWNAPKAGSLITFSRTSGHHVWNEQVQFNANVMNTQIGQILGH